MTCGASQQGIAAVRGGCSVGRGTLRICQRAGAAAELRTGIVPAPLRASPAAARLAGSAPEPPRRPPRLPPASPGPGRPHRAPPGPLEFLDGVARLIPPGTDAERWSPSPPPLPRRLRSQRRLAKAGRAVRTGRRIGYRRRRPRACRRDRPRPAHPGSLPRHATGPLPLGSAPRSGLRDRSAPLSRRAPTRSVGRGEMRIVSWPSATSGSSPIPPSSARSWSTSTSPSGPRSSPPPGRRPSTTSSRSIRPPPSTSPPQRPPSAIPSTRACPATTAPGPRRTASASSSLRSVPTPTDGPDLGWLSTRPSRYARRPSAYPRRPPVGGADLFPRNANPPSPGGFFDATSAPRTDLPTVLLTIGTPFEPPLPRPPRPGHRRTRLPELRRRCHQRPLPRGQRSLPQAPAHDRHHQQTSGRSRQVLHDADLAEAILDRLLERGTHFVLRGRSYRTRHRKQEDAPDSEAA